MKKITTVSLMLFIMFSFGTSNAQFKKKKKKNKFECGYVHKKTLKERMNVSALVGRAVGGLFTKGSSKFDFNSTSVSFMRSNHIYPQGYIDAAFKMPGWEACGTYISAFSTSKIGIPLIEIPGFSIDGKPYKSVAFGMYMQGFSHKDTSEKRVEIKDNDGNAIAVDLKAIEGFKIKSVNGVPRWDVSLEYDGESDMVIELDNTINSEMKIGVELHNKISGVRFNSPVFYSDDKSTITIPKEAFRNSLKFIEDNMLIVYKFKETLLDDQAIGNGALRIVDTYYDFTPIKITGKLEKSIFVKIFDKENHKIDEKDLSDETKYDFEFKKADPLYYHPSSEIDKIAIPSFVIRGNLKHKHVDVSTSSGPYTTTTTTTTLTKWFPNYNKETWKVLANRLYDDFEKAIQKKYNVPIVDVNKIIISESYKKVVPILDTVTKSFVEVGAYGTQRVLPSIKRERAAVSTTGSKTASDADAVNKGGDFHIQINTFPSDFVSSRVMKEFGTNCAVTVNFDLEFDIQAEALLPVVSIKFYAPGMNMYSSGMMHYYQEINAYYKESISLKEASKIPANNTVDIIYNMIDAPKFFEELIFTLDEVSKVEAENPVYQKMFDAMH